MQELNAKTVKRKEAHEGLKNQVFHDSVSCRHSSQVPANWHFPHIWWVN